jgi:hypothetical protein
MTDSSSTQTPDLLKAEPLNTIFPATTAVLMFGCLIMFTVGASGRSLEAFAVFWILLVTTTNMMISVGIMRFIATQ